jgi:hypothetical protein
MNTLSTCAVQLKFKLTAIFIQYDTYFMITLMHTLYSTAAMESGSNNNNNSA